MPAPVEIRLFREDEPQPGEALPPGGSVVLGRSPDADLQLYDRRVSRQHLRLTSAQDGVWVEDLGSAAGSLLDGEPLAGRVLAPLPCELTVGCYRIELFCPSEGSKFVWDELERGDLLGEGAFGRVFAATSRADGIRVAVKEIALGAQADLRERLEREARLCEAVAHPNVVKVHALHFEGDRAFQVMELVEGGRSLSDRLAEGPLPVAEVQGIAEGMVQGLHALHQAGVVHRDIKPANVMLSPTGQVKITDFGLARRLAPGETLTQEHMGLGTMAYTSPEQAADARRAVAASDLYSLGATLFHLLSGAPPFQASTVRELLEAIHEQEPPSLLELRPDCPPALAKVVHRLLGKDPIDRYASAAITAKRLTKARG
jgi:serine/threonine-protein kinase